MLHICTETVELFVSYVKTCNNYKGLQRTLNQMSPDCAVVAVLEQAGQVLECTGGFIVLDSVCYSCCVRVGWPSVRMFECLWLDTGRGGSRQGTDFRRCHTKQCPQRQRLVWLGVCHHGAWALDGVSATAAGPPRRTVTAHHETRSGQRQQTTVGTRDTQHYAQESCWWRQRWVMIMVGGVA